MTETATTTMDPATRLRLPIHNGHALLAGLRRHRREPVMTLGDTVLTGADVLDAISRYVSAFAEHGVVLGTPSALLALNRPEVLFILGAGQVAGHRRTALHPMGGLDDHVHVLGDAGITSLVIDPQPAFVQRARELVDRVPALTKVLVLGPVPAELSDVGVDLIAAAAEFEPTAIEAVDLEPDAVISISYTGGTTGKPKGVVGTAATMATMTQIQLSEWEWPKRPKFLICTPLSHAGAAFFLPVVVLGGQCIVLPRFDAGEVLRAIEEYRISATMLVPSMLYALLDHPDIDSRDLSSLETVYYGASSIDPARLTQAIERFGPIFAQYYGQSEAPMAISYLGKGEHVQARLTSCGRPSVALRTALLDAEGNRVERGEAGEICVSGPLLAGGYLNLPEVTAETFHDGWLHTGDLAREDEDGFWHIVGRSKDMIVTGGFNVFPREVEDVIGAHPRVSGVAVVGVADARWGEAVTAVVVLTPGTADDPAAVATVIDEIGAEVKRRKGSVQAPKHVLFVDALPLTGLGKIDKKAVRAHAEAQLG
ncbi:acyl-CoA synthetase (AMP-forming)/AMP-acid ligase II [Nocardia nova SH22a]|uniref:Acyl-CoA synthetase (AMP-forming)/AMP-acid ligase II n=1 Tax=Nocardia nova SH22a TaxID=1415166 RepID=W5TDY0_9NOCA|nr:fatty-acid--CoA ligase FadD8 [Nocardia nova]AHH17422.1 acyl-CoA synthetase (AMP-forming)/AMP-acid ligase II [Nocardia nova SH22a]